MRALELYAGIGGFAAAIEGRAEVVAAVDQNPYARTVYQANFPHPTYNKNLVGVRSDWLAAQRADLWWMSPPCQPYTVRGAQRDLDDPRSASFRRLLSQIDALRPNHLGLENVPGFAGSQAHHLLRQTLLRSGYHLLERELCPSTLGVPSARRRFYLLASQQPLRPLPPPTRFSHPLKHYLKSSGPEIPARILERFIDAFHVVDADDPDAIAACFTSAYLRSPVYAGSYLRQQGTLRAFSPEEIAALLHFPDGFHFPASMPARKRYDLIGNSLSVAVVRWLFMALP